MYRFGENVKRQRLKMGKTQEDLCAEADKLSVRQLSRIESGESTPTLYTIQYIASQLQVSIDDLAETNFFVLPERYQTLKYLLLRTQTYSETKRLLNREAYLEEIYVDYYEQLPEEEQLVIDCLQSKLDVHMSENINFGITILNDYFEQLLLKKHYTINDLILIELYFICISTDRFSKRLYHEESYHLLMANIFSQVDHLPVDNLYVLNNVLLNNFGVALKLGHQNHIEAILETSYEIMMTIQDFQKMPILKMLQWKYYLDYHNNHSNAEKAYQEALSFSDLIEDKHLKEKIKKEWAKDNT
ncbi:helix-turn-helix domain-containing protein [Streptococcus pacificus]|uniref:Helix-turn-helix domain-containing protein n=1 Tax=Streptococcus pacificus TaxID=2740577 RepID=A0ABS0ZKN9_9STRE|nr:XRE family transcriptional regulator [Streptococcus pacificus]MBJ8326544.1 helix-turn-helix domain-containing protein [Streptococcus pacificus]